MDKNLDIIFIIGPQGSGKGTQAKRLAERLGFFYWENGAICREAAKEDSETGREAKKLHDSGMLFPDELIYKIAQQKFASLPQDKGIIFDGLPRRLSQAEFLMDYLKRQGRRNFTTVFLSMPREESLKRLLKRAEIEHRKDDTRETIEARLAQYKKETVPVLEFLKPRTTFMEIDGTPPVEEVEREIDKALSISLAQ